MYAESVALLASVSFGITAVLLKRGYRHSSPLLATLFVLAVNMALLWAISLLFIPVGMFLTKATPFFILGGILGQGLARTFRYLSIERIGASRTYTIVGTSPVFAAVFAILILGEVLTIPLVTGTLLVVGGVALLSGEWKNGSYARAYLAVPVAAGLLYGLVAVIQKLGLAIMPSAIVGATIAVTSAFAFLAGFTVASGRYRNLKLGRALPHFIGAGVFNSIAFTAVFEAIRAGNVTAVMPIIGTQPLVVAILSRFFLKGHEKVTWNVVLGSVSVVAGVAVITAF